MIPLPLAWTVLIVLQLTSVIGSGPVLLEESIKVVYPQILGTETIDCDCFNTSCDTVYWFYNNLNNDIGKFLGKCNKANRAVMPDDVDKSRFKISKKSTLSFSLRISYLTENDTGIYSCVVTHGKALELWRPGVVVLPGVIDPALTQPKPKQPDGSECHCSKNGDQEGCGSLILWPTVGLIATLALALIFVLYYFSRLPKKCRHHFVKKR